MSFSIFAAGSNNFHYEKDDCIDGSDFEPIKILAILQSMEPTKMGAAGAAAEYVLPSASITDGAEGIAAMEFLHNLKNAVDFLAMSSGSSDGWISVASKNKHLLWVDTVRFAKYSFSPGDDPGAEFVKAIGQGLKDTNLNNWGVLNALSMVLAKYSNKVGESGRPIINISLSH